MPVKRPVLAALLALLGLALTACGGAVAQSWSGMATDGEVVFVAAGRQVHALNAANLGGQPVWSFPSAPSNATGQFVAEPGLDTDFVATYTCEG